MDKTSCLIEGISIIRWKLDYHSPIPSKRKYTQTVKEQDDKTFHILINIDYTKRQGSLRNSY